MSELGLSERTGVDLTDREQSVLEAVVRSYVDSAEPAGSRTIARRFKLGISPATIRNTMGDLEEKGYLYHPHTSAGRIPTDQAYRFFVDRIIQPTDLTESEYERLAQALDQVGSSVVERLVLQAIRALGLLTQELGIAIAPRLVDSVLERLEMIQVSSDKVLLVATIRSGLVKTVYVDLQGEVPQDALVAVTLILNEKLAGLTLREIRESLPDRLRDARPDGSSATEELLNIFIQSGAELFDWSESGTSQIHLGEASLLAAQPEFTSQAGLKGLMRLTEQRDLLADALKGRSHPGGLQITIGGEHESEELAGFTMVTAEYRVGGLKGVIGVIGPTRMPYEKVIAIVDSTSTMVNRILGR